MVKPPNKPCLQCGNVHWPTQECPPDTRPKAKLRADNPLADGPSIGRRYSKAEIEKEVARAAKNKPPVDRGEQPAARASAMVQAIERINELESEVRVLKRALAEAHSKRLKPVAKLPNKATPAPSNKTTRGRPRVYDPGMSAAERRRLQRAAKAERLDFKG
jgi:hypothetical protein